MSLCNFAGTFTFCALLFACNGSCDDITRNINAVGHNPINIINKRRQPIGNILRLNRVTRQTNPEWTNINPQVDDVVEQVVPIMEEQGFTELDLPEMEERVSVRPLFITYSARLVLTNGVLYNIEGITRRGDALMTYRNKSFEIRLKLNVRKVDFKYNYKAGALAIDINGRIGGYVRDIIIAADFSISVKDSNIHMNDFRIVSFGDLHVHIEDAWIFKEASSILLQPLMDLLKNRIIATVSDTIRVKLKELIDYINENDSLNIKELGKFTLSGLLGHLKEFNG